MNPNRDVLLRPSASVVVERAPETVDGRDPGDDLNHVCMVHVYDGERCDGKSDCVSFCGIAMGDWDLMDDDEPEDDDCIVCNTMWEALPDDA